MQTAEFLIVDMFFVPFFCTLRKMICFSRILLDNNVGIVENGNSWDYSF